MTVCVFCGKPVDTNNRSTYRRVTGWDRPGKAGGSDIVLRERLQQWAHPFCVDRQRDGVSVHQETLA